ncbi:MULTISPECIES: hypothetical protein [unclassified Rickettsia]
MTRKSLDSRLRGNDIRHFFRAIQQTLMLCENDMKVINCKSLDYFI